MLAWTRTRLVQRREGRPDLARGIRGTRRNGNGLPPRTRRNGNGLPPRTRRNGNGLPPRPLLPAGLLDPLVKEWGQVC